LSQGETIVSVDAGHHHGVAVTSTGRVFTWGLNNDGQLGDGTTVSKNSPTNITSMFDLDTDDRIVGVTAGSFHTIAYTLAGSVFVWGLNNHGQLGNNQTDSQSLPVNIDDTLGFEIGEVPVQVAAGDSHTLILTNMGKVFAFGGNGHGQLGIGTTSDQLIPRDIVPLLGLEQDEHVTQLVAGHLNSAIATNNGRMFVFGSNENGQLGPSTDDVLTPIEAADLFLTVSGESVSSLTFGPTHSFYLTSLGRLYGLGENSDGQLGSNITDASQSLVIHRLHNSEDITFGSDILDHVPGLNGFSIDGLFKDVNLEQPLSTTSMPDESLEVYVVYSVSA
jgi:alpha-tubulin suppressor-like RCC1 family protein